MISKNTTFSISFKDIEVLDDNLIKTANANAASEFTFPEGHTYDPEFLYMKVRSVSAGEYWGCNKNADYFPEKELKECYKTFLEAHAFKNHENKNIENAIGDVIQATWNDRMKFVELLIRIDRNIAPSIVRGFEKGFMTDVSMGCKIKHSICSICGNIAKTRSQFCDHIKYQKHHVHPDGRKTYEINIQPRFHDISAVLTGADRTAKALGLYISGNKVAYIDSDDSLEKVATEIEFNFTPEPTPVETFGEIFLEKTASTKEDEFKKIAELKKEIQNTILSIAGNEYLEEETRGIQDVIDILDIFHTKYLSDGDLMEISNKLKNLSSKNNIPVEQVLDKFLKSLELASVRLSPREFCFIASSLIDARERSAVDLRGLNPLPIKRHINKKIDLYPDLHMNVPTMLNILRHIPESAESNLSPSKISTILIMKRRKDDELPDYDLLSDNTSDIMEDIFGMVNKIATERSLDDAILTQRLIKCANEDLSHNNINEFAKLSSEDLTVYECALNDMYCQYNKAMDKYSSDESIVKTAKYGVGTALMLGNPSIKAYSELQKSKARKGEELNTFNDYIARNPENAMAVNVAGAHFGNKAIKKNKAKLKGVADSAKKFLTKKANDNLDIFNNDYIDSRLLQKYSNEQVNVLKASMVALASDNEEGSNELLNKFASSREDLKNYLQICKDCCKIEFRKQANAGKEMLEHAMWSTVFNPRGLKTTSSLPGIAFDALLPQVTKAFGEKKKKDISNK